jgi:hypothetical protein
VAKKLNCREIFESIDGTLFDQVFVSRVFMTHFGEIFQFSVRILRFFFFLLELSTSSLFLRPLV